MEKLSSLKILRFLDFERYVSSTHLLDVIIIMLDKTLLDQCFIMTLFEELTQQNELAFGLPLGI